MKRKRLGYRLPGVEPMVLKDSPTAVAEGLVINIRAAKDQLSGLVEHVAQGNEVIITSDGRDNILHGAVRLGKSMFVIEGVDAKSFEEDFHNAIDDYLDDCKKEGIEPRK